MESPVLDVRRIESADGIPDGAYKGMWCGNSVSFSTKFGDYEGSTGSLYVKGRVDCIVTVAQGSITVRDASK